MTPEERFDQLWRDHAQAVLRYARRRVSPADVDDVVAETFVVVWRRLDDVPAQPLPWLLGVARNVAANTVRSERRRDALADRVAVTVEHDPRRPAPDPVADALDDVGGDLIAALRRLPDSDQEVLTLLAWDGLSQDEAARTVGCSRGAFRVRLFRARRRFGRLLAEPQRDSPGRLALAATSLAQHTGGLR